MAYRVASSTAYSVAYGIVRRRSPEVGSCGKREKWEGEKHSPVLMDRSLARAHALSHAPSSSRSDPGCLPSYNTTRTRKERPTGRDWWPTGRMEGGGQARQATAAQAVPFLA